MDLHTLSNLAYATIISTSFDLWMSKDSVDTFDLVINFLNEYCHGRIQKDETIGQNMYVQLIISFKVWVDASYDCVCERWKQQLDSHVVNIMFHH